MLAEQTELCLVLAFELLPLNSIYIYFLKKNWITLHFHSKDNIIFL